MLNSALPFALFSFAVLHISTGLSSLLNATTPLFGALVAWLWLGERPGMARTLGLGLGFAGVALLVWDRAALGSGAASTLALLACLMATLCYALAASFTRRYLAGAPPLVNAAGSQLGAALALAPLAALWWLAQMPGARAWLAVLAVGVLCTGVAYVLFFRLIARMGPARALSITFAIPVFAIGYGALLLGERVTAWMLLCGLVIAAGTALASGLWQPGRGVKYRPRK